MDHFEMVTFEIQRKGGAVRGQVAVWRVGC
jgi:hypothetical protein